MTSRSRVYQRFCKYCVELVASLSFTFTHTEWFRLTYRFKKRRCTLPYLADSRPSSSAGNVTYLETFVHKYSGLFTDSFRQRLRYQTHLPLHLQELGCVYDLEMQPTIRVGLGCSKPYLICARYRVHLLTQAKGLHQEPPSNIGMCFVGSSNDHL